MKILEIKPNNEAYSYSGYSQTMNWFFNYYKLAKTVNRKLSLTDFYYELPKKIKSKIRRNKEKLKNNSSLKVKSVVIDEVIKAKDFPPITNLN